MVIDQAKLEAADINKMIIAYEDANSPMLKRDYKKAIYRKTAGLKQYCKYTGVEYSSLGVKKFNE